MDTEPPIPSTNETAAKVTEAATQAWETTRDKANEALQTGERYVRDNPGTSVLSIFGIGFVVGLVVGYSIAQEDRDDYSASARKFLKQWGHKMNLG